MERISVFDMLKIGIGPSSSHTLGPWRAAKRFLFELETKESLRKVHRIKVSLYGSLALTGKGHGTEIAIMLGLSGEDPEKICLDQVMAIPQNIWSTSKLCLLEDYEINFTPNKDLLSFKTEALPLHANGMIFEATDNSGEELLVATYYSVGGGFVVAEIDLEESPDLNSPLPYPIKSAADLSKHCEEKDRQIWQIVMSNELQWRPVEKIESDLLGIWDVMQQCVYRGCHTEGVLPGGLNVTRRAATINKRLCIDAEYKGIEEWVNLVKSLHCSFAKTLKWIGCFAMAVNEENANFGRVVTAPTNGAAGVIPAVILYYICFSDQQVTREKIIRFLLVAGEIGSIFKKGATISAAMGGCQAEIGVSSAMAAAALTEGLGGSVEQALMAAEIAMEHHLGLTCDPVGGLVQIPCIERNSMGAIKAITAAHIALESDPKKAKVSLDAVIKTMWETAQNMNSKYKETSQGGLAVQIPILVTEC